MPDFLNVEDVLAHLDLKEHMLGAEFGCGSAVFTISLAKKLHKGRVYALDIQQEKLSALSGRAVLEKVNNISMVLCYFEA
ncbi:MAG TPA: class I SAM-dependent methyltransferase, partial [Negativicutes bacterium]|nr:class I SAM-dependent methyltransferase [Negativicutes bacterium]